MTDSASFVCPECQIELSRSDIGYSCVSCGDDWVVNSGVLLSPGFNADIYWGEISHPNMIHVLKRAEIVGAERALQEWAKINSYQLLAEYGLDWRRSLCFELTGLPEGAKILDYGCGYGAVGLSVARKCQIVYLADSTFERVRYVELRASELGLSNVKPMGVQDWKKLPIPHGSLDVIIINGVLEWVPTTRPGDALEVQLDFLKTMKDLLRPGGKIFIGIENRYALRYFGTYPDDHTQLRYTSIMPRFIADLYCRLRLKQPYRTLTWSLAEHNTYLKKIGFDTPTIYCFFPDYRYPRAAVRVEDSFALHQFYAEVAGLRRNVNGFRSVVMRLITFLNLWKWLVYSYGVVARKPLIT